MIQISKQFNMSDFRKNWSTYIILGLSLSAMLFFGVCNPESFMHQLDNVAASVDGEEITQIEFSRAYSSETERMRQRYGDKAGDLKIAGQVIDQLLSYRMFYLEGKRLGLTAQDDEIVEYLSKLGAFRDKNGKFSEENFRSYLRGSRYSEASFLEELRRSLTVERLRDLITDTAYIPSSMVEADYRLNESKLAVDFIKIDPEKVPLVISETEIHAFVAVPENAGKIKDYYLSHLSEFNVPQKVHARHILISYKNARSASGDALKRTKDEAQKKAESILKDLNGKAAQFAEIAKRETDEPNGKKTGGDLGFFSAESMVKEFSNAAFSLKPGEISQVVESTFGFHIIQCLEKKAVVNTPLEIASNGIARILLQQTRGPSLAKEEAQKVINLLKEHKSADELMKSLSLEWKKGEDFALTASYLPGIGNKPELLEAILKLQTEGDLVPEAFEVQKSYFIVRLRSRKIADPKQFDAKKLEQLAQTLKYRNGALFLQKFEKSTKEKFEKRNAIYRNPQYLALDTAKQE